MLSIVNMLDFFLFFCSFVFIFLFFGSFDNSIDPSLRCVAEEGMADVKCGKNATFLFTTTSHTGLVTCFSSSGAITQRHFGAHTAARVIDLTREESRTILSCGHVVIRLHNGSSHVFCPDGSVAARSLEGEWTKAYPTDATIKIFNTDSPSPMVSPLSVRMSIDGETGTRVSACVVVILFFVFDVFFFSYLPLQSKFRVLAVVGCCGLFVHLLVYLRCLSTHTHTPPLPQHI